MTYRFGDSVCFWLGNKGGLCDYYVYNIVTPSISPDNVPYVSMVKVSEKTTTKSSKFFGRDTDVFSYIFSSGQNVQDRATRYVEKILNNKIYVDANTDICKFPLIEMETTEGEKLKLDDICIPLIDRFRTSIRRNHYSFIKDGDVYDVYLKKGNFLLKTSIADNGDLLIIPVNIYKRFDVMLSNPQPNLTTEKLVSIFKFNMDKYWLSRTMSYNKVKGLTTSKEYLIRIPKNLISNNLMVNILRSLEWNSMLMK